MFSIEESLKVGWNKFKVHVELSIFTTLLMLAVMFFPSEGGVKFASFIFSIAVTVLLFIIRIGYTKIFLRIFDGESPKFAELFKEYRTFWRYIGVSILLPLIVFGGLILLVIPGLVWTIRLSLAPIIVVDTKLGPIAAIKESYAITRGSFWNLTLFWIIIGILNLAGLVVFVVGLLITIPLSTLASIYVYRELSKKRAGISALLTESPMTTSP